uniref:Translation initiation factor IF-2, chloroplastic n=1 Tax=Chondria tumulosa TaxID=2740715 RepID=A0A896SVF7_9FLOR|nr:translation initiation factor 2 [Chondria tumulosa]QSD57109.1 translation initiation factor 2 [Chondria tumulosa]
MVLFFKRQFVILTIDVVSLSIYSFECSENFLQLNLPKLINELTSINFHSMNNINKTLNIPIASQIDDSYKLDKKYQGDNYSLDIIDSKKTKSKTFKKKRNHSITINNRDIFTDNHDEFFNQSEFDVSSSETRRLISKSRKKDKTKLDDSNFDNNYINMSGTLRSQNLNSNEENKTVIITNPLTLHEFSSLLNIPEAEIITYLFLNKNIAATVNQLLDNNIMEAIASNYHFTIINSDTNNLSDINSHEYVSSSDSIDRSPVITILGHVDHGKTSLLGSILKTNLVTDEFGNITQFISAYEMSWIYNSKTYNLIFLDTPGHESFKAMRLRAAKVTDIVLLVVSVDDGLQPQTVEAIKYIKEINLNCIVVVTKVDNSDQNIDLILQDLAYHDLVPKQWGGEVFVVQVSALNNRNIDILLSKICMLCDVNKFTTNPNQLAEGIIINSFLDKKQGPVASLVIQNGSLKLGDIIASVNVYAKVKSIVNLSSQKVKIAKPLSIVQVLGFSVVPQVGSVFKVFNTDKQAKQFCLTYSNQNNDIDKLKTLNNRISYNFSNSNLKQIQLIIRTDTQGSLEAILDLLSVIPQNKVRLNIISANFYTISNSDLELAIATKSLIITFNINLTTNILNIVKKNNIVFRSFNVIYDLFDYIKKSMLDLIEIEYEKVFIGSAIVRTVFNINKGSVAGCYVSEGKLIKMCYICVYRENQLVYEGILNSLKRLKNDVNEVSVNTECGLMCDYNLWEENDLINAYNLIPKDKTL